MIISPWRKLWWPKCWNQLVGNCLSACKKSTSSLSSYWDIVKTLQTLGMIDFLYQNHSIRLHETFILICLEKINFITHCFLTKTVWSNVFWDVEIYIFWKFIQYTIHQNKTQLLKTFPSNKINDAKNALSFPFTTTSNSSQFYF